MPDPTSPTDIQVPNPNYRGQAFLDPVRVTVLDSRQGIQAQWSQLVASGLWKVRTLLFALASGWTQETAQAWATAHREELKSMDKSTVKVKAVALAGDKAFSSRPTPGDLELINELAREPLAVEEVYVAKMRLANDQVDRDFERFSRGVLNKFAQTLPGKSVLIGHDHRSAPVGRFYGAKVVRDKETKVTWLEGSWYAPITAENEHARKAIDSGIWSNVSVGFVWDLAECDLCKRDVRSMECPHIPGKPYPIETVDGDMSNLMLSKDGKQAIATVTYKGDAEAVEGSIVYLGAQYDAAIVKAHLSGDFAAEKAALLQLKDTSEAEGGADDGAPLATDEASDTGAGASAEHPSGTNPAEEGHTPMAMSPEEQAELDGAKAAIVAAEAQLAELKAAADAEAERVKALRSPLVAEVKALGLTLKRDAELKTYSATMGEDFEKMPDDVLVGLKTDWQAALDASLPGQRQSTPGEEPTVKTVAAPLQML